MNRHWQFVGVVILLVAGVEATAQQTRHRELAKPVRLMAGDAPIDVGGFSAPAFADLDGDGRKDLLVGQLDFGRAKIYRNVGTQRQPSFGAHRWLMSNDQVASVPTGCAVGFTPQVIDYDRDGVADVLTGSFVEAVNYLFRGRPDGGFEGAKVIVNRDGKVRLTARRYNSTVFATDWDRDGDLDLLIGRSAVHLVINEGDRDNPVFGEGVPLLINGKRLPTGRVGPVVADWDGDGRDDLIVGQQSNIVWYRDTGQESPNRFDGPEILVSEAEFGPNNDDGADADRKRPAIYPYAVCVADFDDDGKMDLLLGDHYYERRTLTPEQQEAFDAMSKNRSSLFRDYRELVKDSMSLTAEQRTSAFRDSLNRWREVTSLYFDGPQYASRTMVRHGGVWLYRRVEPPAP